MQMDLTGLRDMHLLLSRTAAAQYAHHAALGLQRKQHPPGVGMPVWLDDQQHWSTLHWKPVPEDDAAQIDAHRITEDAAEAIALALAGAGKGWVLRRRLQRGEFADWLLIDAELGLVALEISGVDAVDPGQRRLREKLTQVARCTVAGKRAACVVELGPPQPRLALT
jgi:hypothetical protein